MENANTGCQKINILGVIIVEAAHLASIGAQGFIMSINDIKCLLKKLLTINTNWVSYGCCCLMKEKDW